MGMNLDNPKSAEELLPLVYNELRRLARLSQLAGNRSRNLLQINVGS